MQSIIIKADIESTHELEYELLKKRVAQACKWLIRGKYETNKWRVCAI